MALAEAALSVIVNVDNVLSSASLRVNMDLIMKSDHNWSLLSEAKGVKQSR